MKAPSSYDALVREAIPFVPVHSVIPPWKMALEIVRGIARRNAEIRLVRRYGLQVVRVDRDAGSMIPYLAADAQGLIEMTIFRKELEAIVQRYRLSAIVTANVKDSYLSLETDVAEKNGIRCACIQHVSLMRVPIPVVGDCDLYFAMTGNMAEYLRSFKPRARMFDVGVPYTDDLLARTADESVIADRYPWLKGRFLILIASQPDAFNAADLIAPLMRELKGRRDIGLLLKLHPRDDESNYRETGRLLTEQHIGAVFHREDLLPLLKESSLLLTCSSTTIQWALTMGVRPIAYLPDEWRYLQGVLTFMDPRLTTSFNNLNDLVRFALLIIDNPEMNDAWRARYLELKAEFVGRCDGQAIKRVLETLAAEVLPVTGYETAAGGADV